MVAFTVLHVTTLRFPGAWARSLDLFGPSNLSQPKSEHKKDLPQLAFLLRPTCHLARLKITKKPARCGALRRQLNFPHAAVRCAGCSA